MMSKRLKLALFSVLAGAISVGAYKFLASLAYSKPEISVSAVGGPWETVTTRSLGGSSWGHSSLYRLNKSGERTLVAEIVFRATYIGSNCIIYSAPADVAGPVCWVACGENSPVAIIESWCVRWDTADSNFRHWVQPATGPEIVRDISFEKLINLGSAPK
jgi:hypothetical protein